jgi:uncharacterized protein (TIGR00661 family)
VLAAKAKAVRGEHVLVYQTSESYSALLPMLEQMASQSGTPFVVYGLGKDEVLGGGKVRLRPFSETGFVDDLATARAVIAGGGFSLMGEAVYLGKPMLSVPIRRQFEQILNALYLEKLGYGAWTRQLEPRGIAAFLERSDEYAAQVARHVQDGNRALLGALDALLQRVEKGLPPQSDELGADRDDAHGEPD